MPSAASAKLEKQASSNQAESTDNNSANTPIRQALVIIEHKIRNLEKRKTKLESYRAIQASGKELSSDQRSAVAKYDEVAQSLEFARELSKQMVQLATISEKEQRKQARRDALLRAQAETAKIREVLTIQNILTNFADANVREDFLNGTNGAAKLEENDLQILEKFCIDIHVSRQTSPEDAPFSVSAQKAAEYLSLTIDGRPKAYGSTTFDNVRRIIQTIQDCGYLDKGGKIESVEEFVEEPETEQTTTENEEAQSPTDLNVPSNEQPIEAAADVVNPSIPQQQPQQQQQQQSQQIISPVQALPTFPTEAPSAAAVPAPAFPQQPQPPQPAALVGAQIPQQPPQMQRPVVPSPINASVVQGQVAPIPPGAVPPVPANPLHAAHFPPTTVRAVEQAYFKQHQYIQQMRPLAEVIGSGNFYFLQDSELDSPDLVPSGFAPNDSQNVAPNIAAGTLPPQSPNTAQGVIPQQPQQQQQPLQAQQQPPQQQQQPQMPMPQPGLQQQKAQQQPTPAPIPTQTFTNQSFPPIVPPSAIFPPGVQNPADITTSSPQMPPVFQAPPIPLPQIVGQPPVVVSQQSGGIPGVLPNVESQQQQQQQQVQQQPLQQQQVPQPPQHQAVSSVLTQPNNPPNLMPVPSGPNVPLPGFSAAAKFPANTPLGIHQVGNQIPQVDKFEQIVPPQATMNSEQVNMKQPDEIKDRTQIPPDPNDWDAHETAQQSMVSANTKEVIDTNQWSTEVNSSKNEWNSGFDNQGESNTWNNNQSDSYGNRNNRNNFGNNRNSSGGGARGIRGGNAPPSSSNGYRGRPNTYQQQQQNGRNTGVYFRNNSDNSGYYQNQNGGYSSGNKQDSGNSYGGGNGGSNTYRSRGGAGGPMSQSRQQTGGSSRGGPPNSGSGAPPRSNTNSNRSNVGGSGMPTNPNRSARGNAGAYGSSRPPNSVRQQQQDVNA